MEQSQVNLKDPFLAAILGYLIPGLGHLYQGRFFKAAIYSGCIISLYIFGLYLSDWRIVQYRGGRGEPRTELLSFVAQAGVGAPGLFAINQTRRYRKSHDQVVTTLTEAMSAPFTGTVALRDGQNDLEEHVTGQIELTPTAGRFADNVIRGTIHGTTSEGKEVTLNLGEGVRLGPPLQNDPQRFVEGDIVEGEGPQETRIGHIVSGSIPRSFWNWFAIPLNQTEEQDLHRQLGKYHELALVFTMIAGLLNLLAVWDAYDGPAYGYGHQRPNAKRSPADPTAAASPSMPAGAAS